MDPQNAITRYMVLDPQFEDQADFCYFICNQILALNSFLYIFLYIVVLLFVFKPFMVVMKSHKWFLTSQRHHNAGNFIDSSWGILNTKSQENMPLCIILLFFNAISTHIFILLMLNWDELNLWSYKVTWSFHIVISCIKEFENWGPNSQIGT